MNVRRGELAIADIQVGKRMRRLRPDFIIELARSMQECGLIAPIIVLLRRGGDYALVAGWHRLEAAKALGWTHIMAEVWKMTTLEAQIAEIDSNLCVAPLSPAERRLLTMMEAEIRERIPRAAVPAHLNERD
jgi:ParB-like chromosome segregation protein Spo0J